MVNPNNSKFDNKDDIVEETIDAKDTPAKVKIETNVDEEESKPSSSSSYQSQNRKEISTQQQQQDSTTTNNKKTIIRGSFTRQAYEKAGIPVPFDLEEEGKETFERQTNGKWTRKVTAISYVRTLDEEEFLDWNEVRTGQSDMKRKIERPFNHVGMYDEPVPSERLEFDPDAETNRLVVEDRPKEVNKQYHFKFTKSALQELLDDCNPRVCEFSIFQVGQRAYTVTKKELEKYAGDFDTLYNLKSDPNFKVVESSKK